MRLYRTEERAWRNALVSARKTVYGRAMTAGSTLDIRALARLLSAVENEPAAHLPRMQQIEAAAGPHYCLGVTGPPGAGKSTLTDHIIRAVRARGERIAVIAVDPSSPFTGGAVLGDRIRMQAHAGDPGVFIRSVGSRGARGGLSRATRAMVQIFAAHGFGWILIETVGVGQSEFDIMEVADTTMVVLVPEAGDTVQTLKAGLLEVADIFVVNKADRDGATRMANGLTAMLQLQSPPTADDIAHHGGSGEQSASRGLSGSLPRQSVSPEPEFTSGSGAQGRGEGSFPVNSSPPPPATRDDKCASSEQWVPPVLLTTATRGEGIDAVMNAVDAHRVAAHDAARDARRARLRRLWCDELLTAALGEQARARIAAEPALAAIAAAAERGTKGLYAAVAELVAQLARR